MLRDARVLSELRLYGAVEYFLGRYAEHLEIKHDKADLRSFNREEGVVAYPDDLGVSPSRRDHRSDTGLGAIAVYLRFVLTRPG
jgi:hypothetical protein